MIRRTFISLAAALLLAGAADAQRGLGSTWAPEREQERDRGDRDRGSEREDVPLNSIIRQLRSQYGGQHLDARKQGDRYVISWITGDGRRLAIEVDASTGRVISVRG